MLVVAVKKQQTGFSGLTCCVEGTINWVGCVRANEIESLVK